MHTSFDLVALSNQYNSLDVALNLNSPTDNSNVLSDLIKQYEAGAMSKKTLIELSPYTNDAETELAQIAKEKAAEADRA